MLVRRFITWDTRPIHLYLIDYGLWSISCVIKIVFCKYWYRLSLKSSETIPVTHWLVSTLAYYASGIVFRSRCRQSGQGRNFQDFSRSPPFLRYQFTNSLLFLSILASSLFLYHYWLPSSDQISGWLQVDESPFFVHVILSSYLKEKFWQLREKPETLLQVQPLWGIYGSRLMSLISRTTGQRAHGCAEIHSRLTPSKKTSVNVHWCPLPPHQSSVQGVLKKYPTFREKIVRYASKQEIKAL